MTNDDDLEARLARWRPAGPPPELLRRLRADEPAMTRRLESRLRQSIGERLGEWLRRPWPLAYAGVLAAWAVIFALRAMTPLSPEAPAPTATAQIDAVPADAPAFAGNLAAERAFLLAGKNPEQL